MISDNYALVQWPESQDFMEKDWFREEAILALGSEDITGSSAYFIPIKRYLEFFEDEFKASQIQNIVEELVSLYPVSEEDKKCNEYEWEHSAIPWEGGMNIHEHLVDISLGCRKK